MPITVKEFYENYQRLHNELEKIHQYESNHIDIKDLAGIKLSALEKIKKDINNVPRDSIVLLAGYQTSPTVGPRTFQQIEEFISENKID